MAEGPLKKPQLRGHHLSYIKSGLIGMLVCAGTIGLVFKVAVFDVLYNKTENFYKTYNPAESLKRMNEAGVMQSYRK